MFDPGTRGVTRTTAGGCAPFMTLVSFSSAGGVVISSGATVINMTVPAGKTLYITDLAIATDSTTGILAQLFSGTLVIAEAYISVTSSWDMPGLESQISVPGGAVFKLVFATATTNGSYLINGFIQ